MVADVCCMPGTAWGAGHWLLRGFLPVGPVIKGETEAQRHATFQGHMTWVELGFQPQPIFPES